MQSFNLRAINILDQITLCCGGVMDWMIVSPPNSHVEALSSNVMVFENGNIWKVISFRAGKESLGSHS